MVSIEACVPQSDPRREASPTAAALLGSDMSLGRFEPDGSQRNALKLRDARSMRAKFCPNPRTSVRRVTHQDSNQILARQNPSILGEFYRTEREILTVWWSGRASFLVRLRRNDSNISYLQGF